MDAVTTGYNAYDGASNDTSIKHRICNLVKSWDAGSRKIGKISRILTRRDLSSYFGTSG